ncbi:hypothetical protein HYDPIDRAFT_114471 [Hydnomerulius pinastri MD-312]|uniref:Dynamin N-terminal domain-containing protein n=1 Tax=Hydnomerulius pinastri MD-312 TaxID=994086 RepID=A0A0C9V9L0_9AGAM|nr:hypothetical protein HYDPIDRAFT_114471 [Hydnomerulius pinastri MD-312]
MDDLFAKYGAGTSVPAAVPQPSVDKSSKIRRDAARAMELVKDSMHALAATLLDDRYDGLMVNEDRARWKSEAEQLFSHNFQSRKLVVLGRTGAGKSTAINALLGAPVLSTGADRACTAVATEITYEELPQGHCRAVISFCSKETWLKRVTDLVEDLQQRGEPSADSLDDLEPAQKAWEELTMVYPNLSQLSFPPNPNQLNVPALVEDPIIAPLLGASQTITAESYESLESQLRQFLTSHSNSSEEPARWLLVEMVRIFGAFDALASGAVTIVDIPGFGDSNITRTKRTQEYIRNADEIVLVADMRRAVDDQATIDYLKKFLRRLIGIDGRKGSLMVILTGSDCSVDAKQLRHVTDKEKAGILELEQAIIEHQNVKEDLSRLRGIIMAKSRESSDLTKVNVMINEKWIELRDLNARKDAYVAQIRTKLVTQAFQNLYRQTYHSITQDPNSFVFPLPVFCVGSKDCLRLSGIEMGEPTVFRNISDTGVPDLRKHIQTMGQRLLFSELSATLSQSIVLIHDVRTACQKALKTNDLRLGKYVQHAGQALNDLQKEVNDIRAQFKSKVEVELTKLRQAFESEAQKAAEGSGKVILELDKCHYKTYSAIMRRHGQWRHHDLNGKLSEPFFGEEVFVLWNNVFNDVIPAGLRILVTEINTRFDDTLEKIRKRSQKMRTVSEDIRHASELIVVSDKLVPARRLYNDRITTMQRSFDGSTRDVLKAQLTQHYLTVGAESGKGMWTRMKALNEDRFGRLKAQEVYDRVVNRIFDDINQAQESGESYLTSALSDLYRAMSRSLVEIQGHCAPLNRRRRTHQSTDNTAMLEFLSKCETSLQAEAKTVNAHISEAGLVLDALF